MRFRANARVPELIVSPLTEKPPLLFVVYFPHVGLVNMHSVMATGVANSPRQAASSVSTSTPPNVAKPAPSKTVSVTSSTPSSQVAPSNQPAPRPQPPANSGPPKPMSWASIASAAPKKPPAQAASHPTPSSSAAPSSALPSLTNAPGRGQSNQFAPPPASNAWPRPGGASSGMNSSSAATGPGAAASNALSRAPRHRSKAAVGDGSGLDSIEPTEAGGEGLEKLRAAHEYNPKDPSVVKLNDARFFVIKSYSEDDIHRSIKYSVWTSTEHGNKRLDTAYREQRGKPVYLFFSVNGSGHFCGCARMCSDVDYTAITGIFHALVYSLPLASDM